jgi:hypothetical protein
VASLPDEVAESSSRHMDWRNDLPAFEVGGIWFLAAMQHANKRSSHPAISKDGKSLPPIHMA